MERRVRLARECCVRATSVAVILAADHGEHREYRKIRMSAELAEHFRQCALSHLVGLEAGLADGTKELVQYDPSYRSEAHEVDYIDTTLEQNAGLAGVVAQIPSIHDTALYDGDEEVSKRLSFYVIQIQDEQGGTVRLFRKYSPKKELSRGRKFAALYREGTFDKIEDKVFLFDDQIDFFESDRVIFVSSMYNFQLAFKYYDQVREHADHILADIGQRIPIANYGEFQDCCKGQIQMLAKLQNVSRKPYFQQVTMDDLRRTIDEFGLEIHMTVEDGQERLLFERASRWEILKLLDDDYLGSTMTNTNYMVNSKKAV